MRHLFLLTCSVLISTSLYASKRKDSRFKWRCDFYIDLHNEVKCNSFIDKSLRKGKLSDEDLCIAFFYKCKLYSRYYDWNAHDHHRFKTDYPNRENGIKVSLQDTMIKYSNLLLTHSGSQSTLYKSYLNNHYSSVCYKTVRSWAPESFVDSYYYLRNYEYCSDQLNRISVLKEQISDFPEIDPFLLELHETNLLCQFGLMNDEELDSSYVRVQKYMNNRLKKRPFSDELSEEIHQDLNRYTDILSELSLYIRFLFSIENYQGPRLFELIPHQSIQYYFPNSFFQPYVSAWKIDQTEESQELGVIDFKDSTSINSKFSIPIEINIQYDIPSWDTLIIYKVFSLGSKTGPLFDEGIRLSGKGLMKLSFDLEKLALEEINEEYFSNTLRFICNRGKKEFTVKAHFLYPENNL